MAVLRGPGSRALRGSLLRISLLVLLVALHIVTDASPVTPPSTTTSSQVVDDVCYTDGCNHTASELSFSINAQADPCQDFYQFACGGYEMGTEIPEDSESVSVISQMESKLRKQLQQLLSEPDREADPAAFNKAKTLYRSCVNTTRLEERGLEPARKILEMAGGWPLLENDSWDESKFDWQQTLYAFEEMGISSEYFLFNVAVSVDAKNATKHITHISPPVFHLNVKPLDIKSQLVHIKKFVDQLKASALLLAEPNSTRTNASLIEIESRLAIGFEVALNRVSAECWPG